MNEQEFKKEYRKLQKFEKKAGVIAYVGLGLHPVLKNEQYRKPLQDAILSCLQYEPFAEWVRTDFCGLEDV